MHIYPHEKCVDYDYLLRRIEAYRRVQEHIPAEFAPSTPQDLSFRQSDNMAFVV